MHESQHARRVFLNGVYVHGYVSRVRGVESCVHQGTATSPSHDDDLKRRKCGKKEKEGKEDEAREKENEEKMRRIDGRADRQLRSTMVIGRVETKQQIRRNNDQTKQ